MKILLVDPPFQRFIGFYRFYFPLGLTYLAAVLMKDGHEVLIYDGERDPKCISSSVKDLSKRHFLYGEALKDDKNQVWQEFQEILGEFEPDIVGISVLSVKLLSALKIAKLTKQFNKHIVVVAGGEHVTVRPEDVFKDHTVDFAICGEGEQGMVELVNNISNSNQIKKVINSSLISDLDTIPFPSIDSLLNVGSYRPIDLGLMMTARGCPFSCTFCGLSTIWGHKVRYHSINRILDEIELRKRLYNTDYFSFRNGTFTLDKRWVKTFCQRLIDQSLNIKWECLTRVDVIDDDLVSMMKQAGCETIRIGIESGSQEILDYMQKGISLDQVRKAAKVLNNSGIFWGAYFMLGVPMETLRSMDATLRFMKEINPPFITLSKYTPLPGTKMYQEVVDSGLLDPENTDWLWGANQSIEGSFTKLIEPNIFAAKMEQIAQYVKESNENLSSNYKDVRIKKE
jgi:anaerobic magnesium-protoporphyrin IX monomethyl ester cyclase